jgi:UDP-N-acetylmuramate: L-alanyl-gamma-D-glutamyl-meso-diaminopimelate ligase
MSTQLEALGIRLMSGYEARHLEPAPELVVVGNALSRGNVAIEHVLERGLPYVSGPEWLARQVLPGRNVLAVAGTHGKTTTTSLLAWILEHAGREPGFLVGGVPENFGLSARLGRGREFVIEADEYDTAFFDKRSKFVHYRPRIAILNNLEYDHADIFPDVTAIQRQFHHLVRTVPGGGRILVNGEDARLAEVLAMGCWTPVERFAIDGEAEWRAVEVAPDGSAFTLLQRGRRVGRATWPLLGRHSVMNALAAIAAAAAAGVAPELALAALPGFLSARRRLELLGVADGVSVYDDFAHHPTAIATTLAGLRARVGTSRLLVGLEPRSNSMRMGAHLAELAPSLIAADRVVLLERPELPWDAARVTGALDGRGSTAASAADLVAVLAAEARAGDHVVFMSNGGFDDAPRALLRRLGAPPAR